MFAACEDCGVELKDGDRAIGVTTGRISADAEGFMPSDTEPWLEILCIDCWDVRVNNQRNINAKKS